VTPVTPVSGALRLEAAGETLWLLPSGAAWWPAARTLFAADLHLGKGAAFRAQGQPVPAGSSARTLARLEALAVAHDAEQLVVLGDFWHGAAGLTPTLLDEVGAFAARLPTVLVRGNHDRRLDPPGLPLRVVDGALPLGPLLAAHEPPPLGTPGFTLAGHWHPAVQLGSRAGDRLRRPCFACYAHALVLPAFGGLTGALTLRQDDLARDGASIAVIGDGQLHWLQPAR
jgi:DNA ligase-associated metallophosphoesterase